MHSRKYYHYCQLEFAKLPGSSIHECKAPELCSSIYGMRSRKKMLALLSRPMRWLSST